jgi:hypothetical protein
MNRMTSRQEPIYIARDLEGAECITLHALAADWGLEPEPDLHVTLAYSTAPVDWSDPAFAPREDRISFNCENVKFERFGPCIVLVFQSPEIDARWADLIAAGASWDFPEYNSHVTIGYDRAGTLDLPPVDAAPHHFSFGPEYRKNLDPDYGDKKED